MIRHVVVVFLSLVSSAQVTLHPADNVPKIVSSNPAGTTFIFTPGTYRLSQSIIPKNNDQFIGQTSCAPPTTSCPAIISGGVVIGPLATFNGTNYEVTGQTQHAPRGVTGNCDVGWEGCIYPEDLFFDGVPYQHLDSALLPTIGTGQWWFDYTNHIIYFHDNPSGHTVETSVLNNAFGGSANNVTIQYLTIEEFADMYPVGAIGVNQSSPQSQGANWKIENCEVLLNHGFGVRVGYGTQVLNNYIRNNGQAGIGGGIGTTSNPSIESVNSGVLIQGNTINYNDYAHFNPGFGSGGFKVGATSGITLRGNTIQHNEGAGIHFDVNSQNELVDGNTITDNSDADGLVQEIGYGTSTFRNNIVLRNGAQLNSSNSSYQIAVRASAGVNAYCNVMEVSNGLGIGGWAVGAANRGASSYPPHQYLVATGNSFHHNTVIWDSGASGGVGYFQNDAANQPSFFVSNAPPDFNTYHLPSTAATHFIYDNNNTGRNNRKTFGNHQMARADVHGTADTNYTSGFPTVAITYPVDQSSFTKSVMVAATASDTSRISKVEFYVDWNLQATVTTPPYNFSWTNGTTGSHTIAAMAYSNAGIRACYAVTLNNQ
jgi:parallel beta-helix repeat protein